MPVTPCGRKGPLKEESRKNQQGLKMLVFPEKKQWYHLFACKSNAKRAITAQSWTIWHI